MNEIIKALKNHRSVRRFTDEAVLDEQIRTIVEAAQQAPTSINGQQVSVIAIKDKERRYKMSGLGMFQSFVKDSPVFLLFCVDFNRAKIACELNKEEMQVQHCLESTLVGAVDAGLFAAYATVAAESLGLGTVIIGGLREHMDVISEFVDLPSLTFPIFGMAIGHPAEVPDVKPRLPLDAVLFEEKYDNRFLKEKIEQYDADFLEYTKERSGDGEPHNWSGRVAYLYRNEIYKGIVPETIKKQGFGIE